MPDVILAEARTPDGGHLALVDDDGAYLIRLNGEALMHSAGSASEALLGRLALARLPPLDSPRVLVGGLGLGFTLRSVLELAGPEAHVDVVELMPEVVDWNRRHLQGLNGRLLDDPRVRLVMDDLYEVLHVARSTPYHAVVVDVDNGPLALVQSQNQRLYHARGIQRMATALASRGRAAIWSAGFDPNFAERLSRGGFAVNPVPARLHPLSEDYAYTIYLADKAT